MKKENTETKRSGKLRWGREWKSLEWAACYSDKWDLEQRRGVAGKGRWGGVRGDYKEGIDQSPDTIKEPN